VSLFWDSRYTIIAHRARFSALPDGLRHNSEAIIPGTADKADTAVVNMGTDYFVIPGSDPESHLVGDSSIMISWPVSLRSTATLNRLGNSLFLYGLRPYTWIICRNLLSKLISFFS
jgi:hypothetical protein